MALLKQTQPWYKQDRNREIIRLYVDERQTLHDIAVQMGISSQRVSKILRAHDIPRSRPGRRRKDASNG